MVASEASLLRSRTLLVGLAVGIPLSVVFLWLALRGVDPAEVKRALDEARAAPLALALLALSGLYAAQAERWWRIAAVPNVGRLAFGEMVVSAVACNNVLPARLGDLFRARWLGRRAHVPGGRALATVVLDRGCDLVTLVAFLLVTLPEVTGSGWSKRVAVGSVLLVLALAVVIVFARAYTRRRARARLTSRSLVRRVGRDVVDGLAQPMGRRRLAAALVLSVSAWLAFAAAVYLVARSLDVRLGLADVVFTTAVINLGVAIPSSPGFVGTYQWLGVAALTVAGVDRSTGLAFAILLQALWYIPTTLVGGTLLAVRGWRRAAAGGLRKSGSGSAF